VGRIANVTFACADPGRLAEFWAAVLDYEVQVLPEEILRQLRDAGVDMNSRAERKTETLGPFTSSWVVMTDPEENGFCVQAAR
jgi:hypothetical protein